jgi:hypothetical protein
VISFGKERRISLCALFILAAVALSLLHAASQTCDASNECLACRSLHAPAIAGQGYGISRPLPPRDSAVVERVSSPLRERALRLRPLRAPPSPSSNL